MMFDVGTQRAAFHRIPMIVILSVNEESEDINLTHTDPSLRSG